MATISVESNNSLGNLLPEFDTSFDSFGIAICHTFYDCFLASIRYAITCDYNGIAYGDVVFNSLHTVAMLRRRNGSSFINYRRKYRPHIHPHTQASLDMNSFLRSGLIEGRYDLGIAMGGCENYYATSDYVIFHVTFSNILIVLQKVQFITVTRANLSMQIRT